MNSVEFSRSKHLCLLPTSKVLAPSIISWPDSSHRCAAQHARRSTDFRLASRNISPRPMDERYSMASSLIRDVLFAIRSARKPKSLSAAASVAAACECPSAASQDCLVCSPQFASGQADLERVSMPPSRRIPGGFQSVLVPSPRSNRRVASLTAASEVTARDIWRHGLQLCKTRKENDHFP